MDRQEIILVHGIRTHARWYERAKQLLEAVHGVTVHPVKYGRLDLLRFIFPGPWRRRPVKVVTSKVSKILERAAQPQSVTIICHSNGTHLVAEMLRRDRELTIGNLILCGSVVNDNYDWDRTAIQVDGSIINEFGVRDMWPAFAKCITFGYGYSGTNGIGFPVKDRIHDCGHSDYFTTDFISKFWIPYIRDREFVPPGDLTELIPDSPKWFYIFEFPWKFVFFPALFATLLFAGIWAGLTASLGTSDASRYISYYTGRLPSGHRWEGGEAPHDACIGDNASIRACRRRDEILSTEVESAGFKGYPDVVFQVCPNGRTRDKGAALRSLLALRNQPPEIRKWGYLKYRRYKHVGDEPRLPLPSGIAVTVLAPQSIAYGPWKADERRNATQRLRAELSALPFVPDNSITVIEHKLYNGVPYHVVFCSRRILGL